MPLAQRGAWTGGPAHPLTGATDDICALADQLLPEQRYGAMVVELPDRRGVVVDLGPKRLPLVDATSAREVRAWQPKRDKPSRELRQDDRSSATSSRCGSRADGKAATLAQRPACRARWS